MPDSPMQTVLGRLKGAKRSGKGYTARCPAHEDKNPSLSVSENSNGDVLLHCHTNCTLDAILAALSLKRADLFSSPSKSAGANGREDVVATYPYVDEGGNPLMQVRRTVGKQFYQWRSDGNGGWLPGVSGVRRVPYHLPQLLKAVAEGRGIFIPEGEKDVEALEGIGMVATTNPGGAGKWRPEFGAHLKGATVYVLPDNDGVGRKHAEEVAKTLHGIAKEVRVVPLPELKEHGDVSNWIAAGGSREQLTELVKKAQPWTPTATAAPKPEHRSALRSLAEILSDPAALSGPEEVVPRFAWLGRVTLLAGREKLGKSTLAGAAASAVSSGGRFIGQEVKAGAVLIVGLEEHVSDLASRLNDFGADPERLFVLGTLPPGRALEAIEEAVTKIAKKTGAAPRLIVVDTLPRLAEGLVQESGSSSQWTPVMSALTSIARTSNAALVLLHHARKSDDGYRDSTAVGAGVDAIIEMGSVQDEEAARRFKVRARWRTSDFSLRLIGTQYESVSGAVSPETKALFYITENPGCSLRSVREAVGIKATETDNILKRLLANDTIHDGGKDGAHAYFVGVAETRDTPRDTGGCPS